MVMKVKILKVYLIRDFRSLATYYIYLHVRAIPTSHI